MLTEVTKCQSCGSQDLDEILHMGSQPLAERDSDPYPLVLLECAICRLVQLSVIVDPAEVFPADHPYTTGSTAFNRRHFAGLARKLQPWLGAGDWVVDIGANDGTFLHEVALHSPQTFQLGVEPTNQVNKILERGLLGTQAFWTAKLAETILADRGPAKVITASNVLAHVPDMNDFMDGVTTLLAPDGVFVTENHDWASIVNGLQIDTVYHEHLRYFSVASLSHLLSMHLMLVSELERTAMHGGSFRTWAVREQTGLRSRARVAKDQLRRLLDIAKRAGDIYGIGACTRATPLIHYTGMAGYLACICEVAGSEKLGTLMPGTTIPIVHEAALVKDQPPYAVLFAWHIADSIVPKLRAAGYKGQFIVPLPAARLYRG